jgi:exopolysaccharide production protein ExoZ
MLPELTGPRLPAVHRAQIVDIGRWRACGRLARELQNPAWTVIDAGKCFTMMHNLKPNARPDTPRAQLFSIQYLRGLAAFSVLITHALQWPLAKMDFGYLKTGRFGVEVFFVISGFIITIIAGEGQFNPREFLNRRAFRIVPAYWTATFLVAALAIAMPQQFRTTVPTIVGLLKSLLFIPSQEPKAPLLLLGWTLNFEAFFYLVFASLFFLRSTMRTVVMCGVLISLVVIGQIVAEPSYVQAIYTSPSFFGFIAGMILAQAYRHGLVARLGKYARWAVIVAPAILVFAFYAIDWESADNIALWKHGLMSVTAFSVVLLGLSLEVSGKLADVRILRYLGDRSYSIYLFHIFPVAAVWAVSKQVLNINQPLVYLACAAAAICAGLIFGLISYYFIERPFLDASRARSRPVLAA